jgi:amino-acid N-acetyltransferase
VTTPLPSLRASTRDDDARIRAFLEEAGLPAADVETGGQEYLLLEEGGRLVGTIGLEVAGHDGLVRSLAVAPDRRGRGLAADLNRSALDLARARGVRALYLLTTTAEGYAARSGFERVPRAEIPPRIAALAQFRALCPSSATCMRRRIASEASTGSSGRDAE